MTPTLGTWPSGTPGFGTDVVDRGTIGKSWLASSTLLPAYLNVLATGKMKSGVPLPSCVGNGFDPKSRCVIVCGSPLYQMPSCDVLPYTTSGDGAKPMSWALASDGIPFGPVRSSVAAETPVIVQAGTPAICSTMP